MQHEAELQALSNYHTALLQFFFVVLFALVFGIAATVRMVRGIRRQLLATLDLTQAVAEGTSQRLAIVSAISEGNLDQTIYLAPLPQIDLKTVSSDEVGDMVRTVAAMSEFQTATRIVHS